LKGQLPIPSDISRCLLHRYEDIRSMLLLLVLLVIALSWLCSI